MAFLQAMEAIDQAANILVLDLNQVPSQGAAVLAQARELVERGAHELYASASRVDLSGPESVSLAARRVQSEVIDLRMLLDAVRLGVAANYDAQCDEDLQRIERAKGNFAAAARSVLEEPL